MPDHHQTTKRDAADQKTQKIHLPLVFGSEHQVVHPEKPPCQTSTERSQNSPYHQQNEVTAQVQHKQPNRERKVYLKYKGHWHYP